MYPTIALRSILDGLSTVLGTGDVTIRLIAEPVTLTPDMVVADFTEATFSGYAASVVEPIGLSWDDEAGNAVLSFGGSHFQGTTGAVQNTIYGWWMTAPLGPSQAAQLVQAQLFDAPVPILGSQDAIDLVTTLKIGQPVDV